MLRSAEIDVNRHELLNLFRIKRTILERRWNVAVIIPGAVKKSVQGFGVPFSFTAAFRTTNIKPFFIGCQRRLALRRVINIIRQLNRQIFFRNWNQATLITADYRHWCPPVALSGNWPVAQVIINLSLRQSFFHQPFNNFWLSLFRS